MDFKDNVSSNEQEIESEILSNKKFYESLKNLYELNKIRSIAIYGDTIEFSFSKHLKSHHVGIVYEEDINKCSCRHIIDEKWVLEMKPNYHSHEIDLKECFDFSKCSSKFCWFNFLKILEMMPEEDRIRGLPILFVLLQDMNWPTFKKQWSYLKLLINK